MTCREIDGLRRNAIDTSRGHTRASENDGDCHPEAEPRDLLFYRVARALSHIRDRLRLDFAHRREQKLGAFGFQQRRVRQYPSP
jgi:hypothetical protein